MTTSTTDILQRRYSRLSLGLISLMCISCFEDTDSPIGAGLDMGAAAGVETSGVEAGSEVMSGALSGEEGGGVGGEAVITPPRELSIATYNVQNLFDFVDDPERDEGEFTPNTNNWSMRTYTEKVNAIAEVIKLIDADVVVLQEVEEGSSDTDNVLVALTQAIQDLGGREYPYIAQSPTRDF
jgi:hypothetical protein